MADPVHQQYEALPYPPRDPRDEAKRLITGSPSRLLELNHYVFGGRRDFSKPFRALVAGGGTGDATIMLAQQLQDIGANAEIVYLDWSAAARKIAEGRAAVRKLTNLRFVTGSLLDLPALGLGAFDYVDCCGVLHHLADPSAGLSALTSSVNDSGGLGVMLYGRLGRTGVYETQAMLRALTPDLGGDVAGQLAIAKKLLAQLPATNWLKRNPFITNTLPNSDAEVYDLLLHARDRAYDVPEVVEFVAGAGLRLVEFVPAARYRPETYVSDATLLRRLEKLPFVERAHFAETFVGNLNVHVFYAVKADNPVAPPAADDPAMIPVFCEFDAAEVAAKLRPAGVLPVSLEGFQAKLPLPSLAPAIAGLIDGQRTIGDIHQALQTKRADLGWDDFAAQFAVFFKAFNGIARLTLRRQPS
jgi:SAM-dependent methyltransferase